MTTTFSEYKTATTSSIQKRIYKIEWMDKYENIIDETITDLISGSISIQRTNGVRRSCNIEFENNDGTFTPGGNSLVYISKKIKIYSGLIIDGENIFPIEAVQGIFNVGNPIVHSTGSTNTVSIEGYDNWALLNGTLGGEIDAIVYTIEKGTAITQLVKDVLDQAGIIKPPIIYTNETELPYTINKEAGNTYEDILLEIANGVAWDIYFNANGYLEFKPRPDEQNLSQVHTYTNNEIALLSYDHNSDYINVKNDILVVGSNINGNTAIGRAQDNGIFSDTSIERIGQKTKTIRDDIIKTDEDALARAEYELKNYIEAYEYVDIKSINIDYINEGDIILIRDENGSIQDERYLVSQINRNLDFNSEMTLKAWKVRET